MEILPVYDIHWDEAREEIVDSGLLIGYEVRSASGKALGIGETRSEALEVACRTMWPAVAP